MSKKRPHHRASKAELETRINAILDLRLKGYSVGNVMQFTAAQAWGGEPGKGLQERQVREYCRRADELIRDRLQKKRRLSMGLHQSRREFLYRELVAANDHRGALAVLDSAAKLDGLFIEFGDLAKLREEKKLLLAEIEKMEAINNSVEKNNSELERRIAELKKLEEKHSQPAAANLTDPL